MYLNSNMELKPLKPLEMDPIKIRPFVQIRDSEVDKLLPVLEQRLPYSIFLYNSVVMYPRFRDRMSLYTLFGDVDQSSWIVSVIVAEDYGIDYTISASQGDSKISRDEAIEIFDKCPLFKWHEPHLFPPLEKWLTSIIFEVSVNLKGNVVEVHPSKIFWTDIKDVKNIEIKPRLDDINNQTLKLQKLDPDLGVKFVLSTWKFAKKGTSSVISRNIQRNESAGVYIDGEPVCGVIFHAFGMLSALYTLESHRNKGYANLAMKFAFKELANTGIIPASAVDVRNLTSIAFHQKLGCKMSNDAVDYLICSQSEF